MTDTIYTGCAGRTVILNEGTVHGYVTGFHTDGPHTVGAFVKVPVIDGSGPMLYLALGRELGGKNREVVSVRPISRDEFDRITTLDTLRRDLGWR